MIRKNSIRPFYREVLGDAIKTAWADRRLWPFALAAGVLQTGGIFDVLLVSFRQSIAESRLLGEARAFGFGTPWSSLSGLELATKLESLAFGILIVLVILCCSIVAQGALAAGLHNRVRGKMPKFQTLAATGGKFFWRLVAINIITFGFIGVSKFILLSPVSWAIGSPSIPTVLLYLLAASAFFIAVILFTSVHLLSLNAIVLHDASVTDALKRSFAAVRDHWLAILETAAALFAIGAGVLFFAVLVFFVAEIPVAGLMVLAVFFQQTGLFWAGYGVGLAIFVAIFLSAAAITILFQYAVWSKLYRRVGEGSLLSKVERTVHWFFGQA